MVATFLYFQTNDTGEGELPVDEEEEFETVMPKRIQFKKKEYKRRHMEVDSDDDDTEYMAHTAKIAAMQAVRENGPTKASPNSKKDQEQLFCDFIAGELRQMTDQVAKARLMNKLQNEVFASRIGMTYPPEEAENGEEGYSHHEGALTACKVGPSEHCAMNNNTPGGLGSPSTATQQPGLMGISQGISESDSYKLSPTSGLTSY